MNNQIDNKEGLGVSSAGMSKYKKKRIKEILLYASFALVLFFAAWMVFGEKNEEVVTVAKSNTEQKLIELLEGIEGVGDADVMVYESEDCVKSAVVVCDGARDFQVVISVREAVATALNIEQKNVKIYLKKD